MKHTHMSGDGKRWDMSSIVYGRSLYFAFVSLEE